MGGWDHPPRKVYSGPFREIRLDFVPDEYEPPRDYLHQPGFLNIYLDGEDASARVSSPYLFMTLGTVVIHLPRLLAGGSANASWVSGAWTLTMRANPPHNRILLTLRISDELIALRDAEVPLDQFAHEAIRLLRAWRAYLAPIYRRQIDDQEEGYWFRHQEEELAEAEAALAAYTAPRD